MQWMHTRCFGRCGGFAGQQVADGAVGGGCAQVSQIAAAVPVRQPCQLVHVEPLCQLLLLQDDLRVRSDRG